MTGVATPVMVVVRRCSGKSVLLRLHHRLWQTQLEQGYSVWAEAGIAPLPSLNQGQTWKELVEAASQCKDYKLNDEDTGLMRAIPHEKLQQFDKTRELWNSGQPSATQGANLHLCPATSEHSLYIISTKLKTLPSFKQLYAYAGKQQVQVDFGLCYAEAAASGWHTLRYSIALKIEHIRTMLELVYFLWLEQRQLARGAKMLAKVGHRIAEYHLTCCWFD